MVGAGRRWPRRWLLRRRLRRRRRDARAGGRAQWQRDNPDLAERQAEFFHSLWDDPGGAVAKEELLGSRLTTGTSVASATATTCCAAGARAEVL